MKVGNFTSGRERGGQGGVQRLAELSTNSTKEKTDQKEHKKWQSKEEKGRG